MAICSYFMQGRCKFGDRCWNEHPRDGRQQGHNRYQSQASAASSNWNTSGQRHVQSSNYSRNMTWTNRDNDRSSYGAGSSDNRNRNVKSSAPSGFFSPNQSQNRFGALSNQDQARDRGQDKEGNLLADIIQDFETWESSGQWLFSVYCVLKEQRHLSGFTDISPEELRLECYTSHKEGRFQNYVSSVQQLVNQWKQRIHEIKNWNPSSTSALLNQLTKPSTATVPASLGGPQQFGIIGGLQSSGFGASSTSTDKTATAANFSFKLDAHTAARNAGASSGFANASAFGSKPSSGFGNTVAGSAAAFSFAPPATSSGTAPTFQGFGTASVAPGMAASIFGSSTSTGFGSGFPSSTGFGGPTATGGFGSSVSAVPAGGGATSTSGFGGLASSTGTSGFGAVTTGTGTSSTSGTSLFGQGATISSISNAVSTSAADAMLSSALFTPRNELSQEDLQQFECKMFALGKVPLVPPPVDLLIIK